jgi:endonuclease YncB( thermonuclease family)
MTLRQKQKVIIKKILQVSWAVAAIFILCGNIYFWVDENGVRHFTNIAPPHGINNVEELNETRPDPESVQRNGSRVFRLLKIFDGDTVKVSGSGFIFKIRLVGIDCPEIRHDGQPSQPFAVKAKNYLARLLGRGEIRIKAYGMGGYNRQLAEIYVNGRNVNLAMVRAGFAEVYRGRLPSGFDSGPYFKAEASAKRLGKGIWSLGREYESPRQWRRKHPWRR